MVAISAIKSLTFGSAHRHSSKGPVGFIDRFGAIFNLSDRICDQVGRIFGRFRSTFGKDSHLVGRNRKTSIRLTCPGRLNGGIENQQMGLECDLFDGLDGFSVFPHRCG